MCARILIVDDDTTVRATLADALKDDGAAEICVASSAEHALRIVDEDGAPDVVLSDIRMQGLDGLDLLRVLRQRAPSSKVVLMTAYHDVGTAVSAMREGASDFLCKPFDLPSLRGVLAPLLGPETVRPAAAGGAVTRKWTGSPREGAARDTPGHGDRDTAGEVGRVQVGGGALLADRYEVKEEIGRGAMAVVFRARDRRHERSVAVKALRKEVSSSIAVDRFLGEIRIAARLQHPHVLTLIDSGHWDGVPYFVMPLVGGPSLRRRLELEGPMSIGGGAALLRDVADALAAAHGLGIVHRDVKPENVLLSGRHAWVADFGVARALWDAAERGGTLTGALIGTPLYMAPEQASGDEEVDGRADIYALGVVGYELLCGSTPFSGRGARAILVAHLTADPPSLRARRPDVPTGLEEVVLKCLSKDPARRWQDAESLSRSFGSFTAT